MSDTASPSEDRLRRWFADPRLADAVFAVVIAFLLLAIAESAPFETIAYRVIFFSFALAYGFRAWSVRSTGTVLLLLTTVTVAVMPHDWANGRIEVEELSQVVLLPTMLIALLWHARRRLAVQRRLDELAETERDRYAREQEFLRVCAHALRTPLTVARGHVELLMETDDPAEQQADVDIVLVALDRMNMLAGRLATLADSDRSETLTTRSLEL